MSLDINHLTKVQKKTRRFERLVVKCEYHDCNSERNIVRHNDMVNDILLQLEDFYHFDIPLHEAKKLRRWYDALHSRLEKTIK